MSIPGSAGGRLGPKNLAAKYQNTAIRTMPAMLWPRPPPRCRAAPAAATAGCDITAGELDRSEGGGEEDAPMRCEGNKVFVL
jgi:hypothetical protein